MVIIGVTLSVLSLILFREYRFRLKEQQTPVPPPPLA
jgi:hypothetical protein